MKSQRSGNSLHIKNINQNINNIDRPKSVSSVKHSAFHNASLITVGGANIQSAKNNNNHIGKLHISSLYNQNEIEEEGIDDE